MSVFIIAEAGINHCGDIERAKRMIEVAAKSGADVVKFQSFNVDKLGYDKATIEMLRPWQLSERAHVTLNGVCQDEGIEFMSTPFDMDAVDMLVGLGVKRIKISSGKVNDIGFIKYIADKNIPMILSTGMATPYELRLAWIKTTDDSALLYCVSKYPTELWDVDFTQMAYLRAEYGNSTVGFSDHTVGIEASILAAATGAQIIEKHFTLDRTLPGPDQCCSLEPDQLSEMVRQIRMVGHA